MSTSSYRITGLSPAPFAPLFGKSDADLKNLGIDRVIADTPNSYPVMAHRLLSLRGFNAADKIEDGRVVPGAEADATIRAMLSNDKIRYIHAHNAAHGCYSGLVTRA